MNRYRQSLVLLTICLAVAGILGWGTTHDWKTTEAKSLATQGNVPEPSPTSTIQGSGTQSEDPKNLVRKPLEFPVYDKPTYTYQDAKNRIKFEVPKGWKVVKSRDIIPNELQNYVVRLIDPKTGKPQQYDTGEGADMIVSIQTKISDSSIEKDQKNLNFESVDSVRPAIASVKNKSGLFGYYKSRLVTGPEVYLQSDQHTVVVLQNTAFDYRAEFLNLVNSLEFAIDTTTWRTYQNKEFGFELKYPSNWEKPDISTEDNSPRIDLSPVSQSEGCCYGVKIEFWDNSAGEYFKFTEEAPISDREVLVGNIKAREVVMDSHYGIKSVKTLAIPQGTTTLLLVYGDGDPVADTIVSTIKFMKK